MALHERSTNYTIDCHIRRLLFVMPRLWPGSSPPILREADLGAVLDHERHPRSRFFGFAGTRRVYTRYLRAQGTLGSRAATAILGAYWPIRPVSHRRARSISLGPHSPPHYRARAVGARHECATISAGLSRDDLERLILEPSREISRHSLQHEVAHLRSFLRYAHDEGLLPERLDALDTPRTYRDELPPRALPWSSVLRLVRSIDRIGKTGWRAGKSSLFAPLRGEIHADGGDVEFLAQWRIAHVAQETPALDRPALAYAIDGATTVRRIEAELADAEASDEGMRIGEPYAAMGAADACTVRSRAEQLLKGPGATDEQMNEPVASFSGGWRMRLNLAQALMYPSDVLLPAYTGCSPYQCARCLRWRTSSPAADRRCSPRGRACRSGSRARRSACRFRC